MNKKGKFRRVGHLGTPGGGQVYVQGQYAYIGHLEPPAGTSIVDVSNPKRPRVVSHLTVPPSTHSHKVRVRGDIMLVNYEKFARGTGPFEGGLKIFDIANREKPREISFWRCAGTGIHRFDSDERYAYISPEMDGYLGNITVILDVADPAHPKEVSRWWLPGQWTAGGESPTWQGRRHRTHHPLRLGERLYVSLWLGGFAILDIADLAHPRLVSHLDWSPPYPCPTHTALPVAHPIRGRRWLIATDEDVDDRLYPGTPGFMWLVDITDETRPTPVATFNVPQPDKAPTYVGAHQPYEGDTGNLVYVTWFRNGLRVVDISDPFRLREVGAYIPEGGPRGPMSNDVFVDGRGLVYLMDRSWGLDILEFAAP